MREDDFEDCSVLMIDDEPFAQDQRRGETVRHNRAVETSQESEVEITVPDGRDLCGPGDFIQRQLNVGIALSERV